VGAELEVELAELMRANQLDRAATRALESYAAELYGCSVRTWLHVPARHELVEMVLARETDRLRKRHQLLKDDLRKCTREAGLIAGKE